MIRLLETQHELKLGVFYSGVLEFETPISTHSTLVVINNQRVSEIKRVHAYSSQKPIGPTVFPFVVVYSTHFTNESKQFSRALSVMRLKFLGSCGNGIKLFSVKEAVFILTSSHHQTVVNRSNFGALSLARYQRTLLNASTSVFSL